MGQISTQDELHKAIAALEQKKVMQESELKQDFQDAKLTFAPGNVIKNTFSHLASIPEVRKTMIDTIIGFGLGYISLKASKIMSEESLDNIVGNLVNSQVNRIEENQPESFVSKALSYFRKNIKRDSPLYPFLGYKSTY